MSEIYKQKEWEFRSLIENTPCIPGMFEDYTKEVEDFIDKLLNDTKEINVLRHELKEYKSRNEEAIEYVKNLKNYRFEFTFDNVDRHEIVGCTHNFVKDLLNILNGGDDNE